MRERFGAREAAAAVVCRGLDPASVSVKVPLPPTRQGERETEAVALRMAVLVGSGSRVKLEPWLVLVDPDPDEVDAARHVSGRRGVRLAAMKVDSTGMRAVLTTL